MKIAIIVNGRPHESGVTTYINNISKGLRSLGHTVDVVTMFGVSDSRKVHKKFAKQSDAILQNKTLLVLFAYIFSKFLILFHLLKSHQKNRYDTLYAIDVSSANVALFLKRWLPARFFLRVGASLAKDMVAQKKVAENSRFLDFFYYEEYRAYSRVDAVIPNSTWSSRHIASISPEAKILPPLISPVNTTLFYPNPAAGKKYRNKFGIKKDDTVIFFPSRLDQRKGPLVPLKALRELLSTSSKYRLCYAGRGTEKSHIEQHITKWGLQSHVNLSGMIQHTEMPEMYNMADVVVVPSITCFGYEEPLANCILEAMATGVPVIASAIGGLKDFIRSKHNGILIPEGDVTALAQAIRCLAEDNRLRQHIIQGGFDTIATFCSTQSVSKKLTTIFRG